MPKIDKDEIARIKSEVDIVAVIRGAGVELEQRGVNFVARCPFHDDHEPSFVVNPITRLYNCFGCPKGNSGGDVITFLMRRYTLPFPKALERARALSNGNGNGSHAPAHAAPVMAIKGAVIEGARTAAPGPVHPELLRNVWAHYRRTFLHADRASSYLAGRAISVVAQRTMELGYCDGSLLRSVRGMAEQKAELRELGILNDRGKEHLHGCAVFPLTAGDVIVNLYGRRVKTERTPHLFLPGPKVGMYNAEQLARGAEIILCEGIIDAATLIAHGMANVLPLCGTVFTAHHRELVDHLKPAVVHIALDGDRAGLHAAEDIAARLRESGHRVHLVELGEGIDVNDHFAKHRGSAASFRALLEVAASSSNLVGPCDSTPQGRTSEIPSVIEPVSSSSENLVDLVVFSGEAPGLFEAPISILDDAPSTGEGREIEPAPNTAPLNREADDAPAPQQAPSEDAPATKQDGRCFNLGRRMYRVIELSERGLRATLQVTNDKGKHFDKLDLYSAKARETFVRGAATKLEVSEPELIERDLIELIDLLSAKTAVEGGRIEVNGREREEALKWMRSPNLDQLVLQAFIDTGYIGEEPAKLVAFLVTLSRYLPDPLGALIVSRSGAGKSGLQDAVCSFVPPEDIVRCTRISPQALFYGGEESLRHKVLAIEEESGAADAAYSIRNLQSAQILRNSTTRTDPQTGRFGVDHYVVYGPTAIFLSTTSPEALDYETRNRFCILSIDESREQTIRILNAQRYRETLAGMGARRHFDHVQRLMQNVQRLLKPIAIVNNFAPRLTYPSHALQMRREHKKYLALIRAIACLYQYQREIMHGESNGVPFEYIEVTREDIRLANRLAREVLGRSLDELAPPTRNLLGDLVKMVRKLRGSSEAGIALTRKLIREHTNWSDWQLRTYLPQLVELEYLSVRGRNGQLMQYELLFDGDVEDGRFLPGLIDVDDL